MRWALEPRPALRRKKLRAEVAREVLDLVWVSLDPSIEVFALNGHHERRRRRVRRLPKGACRCVLTPDFQTCRRVDAARQPCDEPIEEADVRANRRDSFWTYLVEVDMRPRTNQAGQEMMLPTGVIRASPRHLRTTPMCSADAITTRESRRGEKRKT